MDFFTFWQDKKNIIILGSVILNFILLLAGGYLLYRYWNYECEQKPTTISLNTQEELEKDAAEKMVEPEKFHVEVKGAVNNPGVYEVTNNSIINDIINNAGGFTKNAYTNNINLSRKVTNELVVFVYTKDEYQAKLDSLTPKEQESSPTITAPCECPTYDISACTEDFASEIVVPDTNPTEDSNSNGEDSYQSNTQITDEEVSNDSSNNASLNSDISNNPNNSNTSSADSNSIKIVNINTASKNELMTLKGIGSSKADLIISYRKTNGNFKSIAEIKNVKGIGDAIFAKIKDYITV